MKTMTERSADWNAGYETGYENGYENGGNSREADYFIQLTDDPRFEWPDEFDTTPAGVADYIAYLLTRDQCSSG
jgi:hypothetical protein